MMTVQTRPVTFTQAVLLRPAMYTLNGTLLEVIAFLEGYHSGMAKGSAYAAPVAEWEAFRRWAANRLCVETSEAFATFAQRHRHDQAALQTLGEWFTQFIESPASALQ